MNALETFGLVSGICLLAYAWYRLDQMDKGQDDTLDMLEELIDHVQTMEAGNVALHATAHHALLAPGDDVADLRRGYQRVNDPDDEDGS